jgi:hypothetical protein
MLPTPAAEPNRPVTKESKGCLPAGLKQRPIDASRGITFASSWGDTFVSCLDSSCIRSGQTGYKLHPCRALCLRPAWTQVYPRTVCGCDVLRRSAHGVTLWRPPCIVHRNVEHIRMQSCVSLRHGGVLLRHRHRAWRHDRPSRKTPFSMDRQPQRRRHRQQPLTKSTRNAD